MFFFLWHYVSQKTLNIYLDYQNEMKRAQFKPQFHTTLCAAVYWTLT